MMAQRLKNRWLAVAAMLLISSGTLQNSFAFISSSSFSSIHTTPSAAVSYATSTFQLSAKKPKKKKKTSGGGGFGGASSTKPTKSSTPTISADKNSLEAQWDVFAAITDLEIKPKGDPEDDGFVNFEVSDVFVRCATKESNKDATGWFRIGKVCTLPETTSMNAALVLQKGLIFWTAVHMRRELVAAGGKSGAASLQLGVWTPATLSMGDESDGPILDEDDGADMIQVVVKEASTSLADIPAKSFGFRPDWNPPGFTYKRREKDAMRKKKKNQSLLDEMKDLA